MHFSSQIQLHSRFYTVVTMAPLDLALAELMEDDTLHVAEVPRKHGVVRTTLWRQYTRRTRSAEEKSENQSLLSHQQERTSRAVYQRPLRAWPASDAVNAEESTVELCCISDPTGPNLRVGAQHYTRRSTVPEQKYHRAKDVNSAFGLARRATLPHAGTRSQYSICKPPKTDHSPQTLSSHSSAATLIGQDTHRHWCGVNADGQCASRKTRCRTS